MFMKKRGQAAMEFLMTYGWAILVVLVVIGALAYFGVLNPQSFLPRKCQFSTGLVCEDHQLTPAGLLLRINNGLGNDISITEITFEADNNQIKCNKTLLSAVTITAGNEQNIYVGQNLSGTFCHTTAISPYVGARVKGDLNITYLDLQTQFSHVIPGTLLTDVEP